MVTLKNLVTFLYFLSGQVLSTTTPPPGCIIVNPSKFVSTVGPIQRAIDSLKSQKGPKVIFIMPGRYVENIVITYKDPLTILGFSKNSSFFAANEVLITVNTSMVEKGEIGKNSGLLVKKDNFVMKNINITNTFGRKGVALTAEGSQHAYRACSFVGVTDTVYARSGAQFFHSCNVEGSVDVVVGGARSWFESCTIGIIPSQTQQIIASNRRLNAKDPGGFIFNKSNIKTIGKFSGRSIFLGRSWGSFSKIVYQGCNMPSSINPLGWMNITTTVTTTTSTPPPPTPRVSEVIFIEMNNEGKGAVITDRKFLSPPPPKPLDTSTVFSGVNVTTWFYEIKYMQAPPGAANGAAAQQTETPRPKDVKVAPPKTQPTSPAISPPLVPSPTAPNTPNPATPTPTIPNPTDASLITPNPTASITSTPGPDPIPAPITATGVTPNPQPKTAATEPIPTVMNVTEVNNITREVVIYMPQYVPMQPVIEIINVTPGQQSEDAQSQVSQADAEALPPPPP